MEFAMERLVSVPESWNAQLQNVVAPSEICLLLNAMSENAVESSRNRSLESGKN
jgi:hypothetical protein